MGMATSWSMIVEKLTFASFERLQQGNQRHRCRYPNGKSERHERAERSWQSTKTAIPGNTLYFRHLFVVSYRKRLLLGIPVFYALSNIQEDSSLVLQFCTRDDFQRGAPKTNCVASLPWHSRSRNPQRVAAFQLFQRRLWANHVIEGEQKLRPLPA